MSPTSKPSFSRRRKWSISLNVLISVVSLLALVLMANYLAARHFWRFPLTWSAQTELSPLTQRLLKSITNEVRVVVFYDRQEPMYESVWGLLKEYKFANPHIRLEAVDYLSDPAAAQMVKAKYQLNSPTDKDMVIFEYPGRPPRFVYSGELSDVDIQPLVSGQSQEVRRTHFKGEMLFTSALYAVLNPRPVKAYFLTNHGEHNAESNDRQSGYSKFAGVLRENSVTVGTLNLYGQNEIPADCHLLIVAGPRAGFLPDELEKIDNYLKQGGRLLVLFTVLSVEEQLGLEKLLLNWGVSVGNNVIIDAENSDRSGNMLVNHITPHPVMKPLYQSAGLQLTLPRSIAKATAAATTPDAPKVEPLATTSPKGRVQTDIRNGVPHESDRDVIGTIPLMVAVEKGVLRGVSAERGATRIIVVGDSMLLSNESIDTLANRDFASHAVNWLLNRNELLANLGPRPIKEYKLTISQGQMTRLRWLLLLGMPGGVLLLGALVWVRRQKW